LSTKRYLREAGGDFPVIAMIKRENIIAQKAFRKAGYVFRRQDKKMAVFSFVSGA